MSLFSGIAFPFQSSAQSLPAISTDDQVVTDSIKQLILTSRGERVMRPDIGCGAPSFVFESNSDLLARSLESDIRVTLQKYEPRAIIQSVTARQGTDGISIIVDVQYIVMLTGHVLDFSQSL